MPRRTTRLPYRERFYKIERCEPLP